MSLRSILLKNKRVRSGSVEKIYKIEARVTREEKENIKKIANEKGMTVSSLILSSIENHIIVQIDTRDYMDLVIQVRRIGGNINGLIQNIYYKEFFTNSDIKSIKQQLKVLENLILDEKKRLDGIKEGIENLTSAKARKILKENNKSIPFHLIYEDVYEFIVNQLLDFIEMLRANNFDEVYIPFVTFFLRDFKPTDYEREELVEFSKELDNLFYEINSAIYSGYKKLSEEDFENVMQVLDKYRKARD